MEHYPSPYELFSGHEDQLPVLLCQRIAARYEGGKDAYATDGRTADGRIINACMDKNSLQDAEEEVVDAVFNLLVQCLKHPNSSRASYALEKAIDLWGIISDGL